MNRLVKWGTVLAGYVAALVVAAIEGVVAMYAGVHWLASCCFI